ncbi:NAD-glutamate dehydrogenase [Roseospirillum parvum]|uniref:Glutamate dehydrogenase n=1 Tax=Roseospirillum parvum TaxID=83401 RepID=A0A1G7VZN0_9PROT|nr:NAD-glutamate dehydrogenase [Roseospirillum parvum]SDG65225.1 glutamate dehydrogenase [Roseospirillum parvum]
MSPHGPADKADLIDSVAALATRRLDPERAGPAAAFVRHALAHAPPDDLLADDPEDLFAALIGLKGRLAEPRRPGRPLVRVFNPGLEADGWQSEHTVVEIINDDMPFLVDSVTTCLLEHDLTVHRLIHPVFRVERDRRGQLTDLGPPTAEGQGAAESVMQVLVTAQPGDATLKALAEALEEVLDAVRAAVEDWRPMQERLASVAAELCAPDAAEEEVAAGREFLSWLGDNHFTLLGHRRLDFTPQGANALVRGLGILRAEAPADALPLFDQPARLGDLTPGARAFLASPAPLLVTKTDRRSVVHRGVLMDAIGVKRFDPAGRLVGLDLFLGLFTAEAYINSARRVPALARRIAQLMARTDFAPRGHDGKALLAILENLPRDELFQSDTEHLLNTALGVLHLQERARTALFVRRDAFERFVSCLVYIPRDRFDTALRRSLQGILEDAYAGHTQAYYTQVADSPLARLHFLIKTRPGHLPPADGEEVQRRIANATRTWADHLHDALLAAKGEEKGVRLLRRYGEAFPGYYRERTPPQLAVRDIERIEQVLADDSLGMNLYRPVEAGPGEARLKIYHARRAVPLSDILPVLENMGFRVIGEVPCEVRPRPDPDAPQDNDAAVWLHDFDLALDQPGEIDLAAVRDDFMACLDQVWRGEVEDDPFNRLVVGAGLTWREVVILRAGARYLRQTAFPFSQETIAHTLGAHPAIARKLVWLFHARHDPQARDHAERRAGELRGLIESGLDQVANADDDRILRGLLNLIGATLRTNYYQFGADGAAKPYLSLKLDSRAIDDLPRPRPWVEVFVYSPRTEGIHLRGGKVARGGIRWSDRREDFRTEILGLMKAQMVKNAVIVPVGSKGGFVVKRPPAEPTREAQMAEGVACYRLLIQGLLDVTDNLSGDTVVPPPRVVRHDGDDPYLVVAADKGTATFSDIANEISLSYGFWLGDAFASGGSKGYDHKAMGITARGAWESVKRHFRELGHDCQSEDFTVAGVGDMAGDVFGNGMLLSPHIRLIAAFNHQHIFLDPNPDAEASFAERRRLFERPRSAWSDYDPARISAGGGVFERSAKHIPLSPEARHALGLPDDVERLTPAALIRAILAAPVDLLWFGGIGTYIKAGHEGHPAAGDRANDAVRLDAHQVRARVIGEGANLGITQPGRIELARAGVRLNTDAIDNSAGVDCSDHEVNIKILLDGLVGAGELTLKQRDALLVRMTDEVARLVLRDNYLQTQAISLVEARGVEALDHQHRLMRMLERAGRLDRALEGLPDDETVGERMTARQGLVRPETAVLMPYSKLWLFDEILDSDLPDDAMVAEDLVRYFPSDLRQSWREAILKHRLRREIIATHVANSLINRVGGTFVTQVMEKTGATPADIARAYITSREALSVRTLWSDIEALDAKVGADLQSDMLLEINRVLERVTVWILRNGPRPLTGALVDDLGRAVGEIVGCLKDVCGPEVADLLTARADELGQRGAPEALARRVATLIVQASATDIMGLAAGHGRPVPEVARLYFALGNRFHLGWLRARAEDLAHGTHWQKLAMGALIDELYVHQRDLSDRVLATLGRRRAPRDPAKAINAWTADNQAGVERADQLIAELKAAGNVDLAMLTVASRQFGALRGG